eukprot:CAMPEP_0197432688 /NCGR_PEP_ID=MMETSP1175-20131217/709_1 /TAXON_ID=1003142 /ORGANISM="Triceratium dubium, Strain CCMP147" /LENGTH=507 /DNA_ID=CAMNT_0042960841 /DNA_START=205 /DNA_END=1724 /DNA_ORIENTATION=+
MNDLTTCMGTNDCFGCLNSAQQGASTSSDPTNRLCHSYVCPLLNEKSCCPQCSSHALAMRTCIVNESDAEAVSSGSVCSCGVSVGEDHDDDSKKEQIESEEEGGDRDSPQSPDSEEQPEKDYPNTKPENPGTTFAPENCIGSVERYYRCVLEEGQGCLSCEGTVKDLSSVTTGLNDAESIRQKICSARQCCCGDELEFAVKCTQGAEAFTFQAGDCVNATSLPGGPDASDSREDVAETDPDDPIEPANPCADAAKEYDQCILNGGGACFSCPVAKVDITLAINDCQSINEQIRSAAQCCCGPEVQQIAKCSLMEVGSTCEIVDFNELPTTPKDPSTESPDENGPEENEPYSCTDLAVIYDECLTNERCFSCVDEAAALSQRSFSAGSASCRAVHEVICPATECCCSDELVALTECSHLEEHGNSCDIDCYGYNSMEDTGDPDDTEESNRPPANLPEKCIDANDLYELCVDTSDCSSCQTVDAIARNSLVAIGAGQSDYSCDVINGMV